MALSMVIVEKLTAPHRARPAGTPATTTPAEPRTAPEPVAVLDGDWLVLRLGGGQPVAAAPAPRAAAGTERQEPRPSAPPPAAHDTYVVQPGDTLSGIAQRELGSARLADELARLNGLADPAAIRAGQVLKLR